jgi:membrane associated rhomboid family serine protease
MSSQSEPWVVVATTVEEHRSAELGLVLTALGIEWRRAPGAGGWQLSVPAGSAARATQELSAYRDENSVAVGQRRLEEIGDGWAGVVAYVSTLLAIFVGVRQSLLGLDWLGAGRLQAGRVTSGEWWRAVTALTVHVDLDHLAGNVVFGAFFGYFVGRYVGAGAGWLAIVAAATAANGLNAFVQAPLHRSIGASTAVFAALGLLTAYTWRRGFLKATPVRARIAPIVAGLGLLAFTGTAGENTDLGAHLAGFVAGFGAGLLLARYASAELLRLRSVQTAAAAAAALTIAAAWGWALIAVG